MIALRKAAGLVTQGAVYLRKPSGLVEQEVYLRTAAGLKLIHTPNGAFSVDVPPTVYGGAAFNGGIAVTTENATVTITGGQGPFTFEWERTDGALGDWTIINPTSQTTAFRCIGVGIGESETAEFACTVRDVNGSPVTSGDVLAQVENYGGLGVPL